MTLHGSKGLEFTYVFIIGVNYGLIPLHASGFEEEEEERRLLFVGMTRARDYLELSYYTQPGMPKVAPGESRYLQMIPERLVERVDYASMTEPVSSPGKTMLGSEEEAGHEETKAKLLKNQESVNSSIPVQSAICGCPETVESHGKSMAEQGDIAAEQASSRQVYHAKYGLGTVTEETEDKITVDFGELGVKSFLKDFVVLESVSEE